MWVIYSITTTIHFIMLFRPCFEEPNCRGKLYMIVLLWRTTILDKHMRKRKLKLPAHRLLRLLRRILQWTRYPKQVISVKTMKTGEMRWWKIDIDMHNQSGVCGIYRCMDFVEGCGRGQARIAHLADKESSAHPATMRQRRRSNIAVVVD
jgi:hypothetical protein